MRLAIFFLAMSSWLLQAAKTLEIYFVDVEGGQATLLVTPAGESLLVDAGWNGFENRDALRIRAAMKQAGIKRIDYLLVTHHHRDHVGGVLPLTELVEVRTLLDHGDTTETDRNAAIFREDYERAARGRKRITLKPGDRLPLKGLDAVVVAARGDLIAQPLPGAGAPNPLCADARRKDDDSSENARSVGFVLTWGRFRFVNLGDLTWNKELDLVCPANKLGKVDLYLSTHHGAASSGPAAIVHALAPRVAVMNNGSRKGGSAEALAILRSSPGLEDLWQLHYSIPPGKEANTPDSFIANLEDGCQGKAIHVSVAENGSFTVTNQRNKFSRSYPPR
jgi:beta-lactamase superfamily II metal-dependent hydrolase